MKNISLSAILGAAALTLTPAPALAQDRQPAPDADQHENTHAPAAPATETYGPTLERQDLTVPTPHDPQERYRIPDMEEWAKKANIRRPREDGIEFRGNKIRIRHTF